MVEIPAKYDPALTESKWYNFWLTNGFFKSVPDSREPFTVVIPPPNVTGVLHMGHMLNNTIQDVLVRRARMQGKNACWVPGTDHASIATEAKVVAKLAGEGIKKTDLTRDKFLTYAWDWKNHHGGIILEQLKKLGASCDWDRTSFTMDPEYSKSVIRVFVDLFNKGNIYRGVRMVNWDPKALTALSDEEVIYKEVKSKLFYLRYNVEGSEESVQVATTRPETILGDTAVCVNPNDPRFAHLKGKKLIVPLINRAVPVIMDEYVDMEFGTGALKVTPAHDVNDYMLGEKYNLEVIDIFNDNGTLNEKAGLYVGQDRFEVRKQIEIDLNNVGLLVKTEDYTNKVGYSERTDVVIEPKLSMQWFVKMSELAKPALDAVMNDEIMLHPAKYKNTYRHWMENVKDWCISRQLWWGHRIPAWFLPQGGYVVAENEELALQMARQKTGNQALQLTDLRQDEDCLDTWFSSWLWPISVFDPYFAGNANAKPNADLSYYYPTNDLVTAPEILFFWVARMIIAGYEWQGKMPFKNVYLHGIVRDKQGRKMSKSLGNSPDPLKLIQDFGADGVRMGMLLGAPAGNDILYDDSLCEQGRNFNNKIWNAFRLVKGWEVDNSIEQPEHARLAIEWYDAVMSKTIDELNDLFDKYRLSEALMCVYKLFWDDFSAWYLEMVKPEYQKPMDMLTYKATIDFFEKLLKLLHPFMPFITEEIWHLVDERGDKETLMLQRQPDASLFSPDLLAGFEQTKEAVAGIRTVRKDNNILNREAIEISVYAGNNEYNPRFESVLKKMGNISNITRVTEKVDHAISFRVNAVEYYLMYEVELNVEEEIQKVEAELVYQQEFLESVMKKLSNERFVSSAPEKVVEMERKKKADSESKIELLKERLTSLKK